MSGEVSASAVGLLLGQLQLAGLPTTEISSALPFVSGTGLRSWSSYARACDMAAELAGGPEALMDVCEATVVDALPGLAALAPLFPGALDFARFAVAWVDATSFRNVRYEVEQRDARSMRVRMSAKGAEYVPESFVAAVGGALRQSSSLFGAGRSLVTAPDGLRQAVLEVVFPVEAPRRLIETNHAALDVMVRNLRLGFEEHCSLAQALEQAQRQSPSTAAARLDEARRSWRLSPREADVLRLLAEGNTNKEIAAVLGCAEVTIEFHVSRLLLKGKAQNRSRLIASLFTRHSP